MKIIDRKFLPKTTDSVHAATIEWWNDHFVYAWFGGSREGNPDVGIYIHNLNNDGKTIAIGVNDNYPRWNPILFSHKGRLYLFEKIGTFCDRWQTFIHDITNWNESVTNTNYLRSSQVLPSGLNGPVKLRPVVCNKNGKETILCGSACETFADWTSYVESYTIDNGKWNYVSRSNPISVKDKIVYEDKFSGVKKLSLGIIQPSIWREGNAYKAFFRSSWGLGKVYYSEMLNKSDSVWSEPVPTNIPNNNSGVAACYLKNNLYLAFNNSDTFRFPLELRKIKQVGKGLFDIDSGSDIVLIGDKTDTISEFSYPYLIDHGKNLHLVYTYGRKKIEHVIVATE